MRSSSESRSASIEGTNKDAETTERDKLLQEIQDLRRIIEQCEWSLNRLCFKEVERSIEPRDSKITHFSRVPNVNVKLQNDLYRFAGFHCVKLRRDELVFNFTSSDGQQRHGTYAIQIFVRKAKGSLGKWVMPMSIDMNYMLRKTPIENLRNSTAFIKNCKHSIDCYIVRQEQFLSLKEHISHMKNCALQSNIGYTYVTLELCGVYDSENDEYINLIIYLLYNSEEVRPCKIKFDTMDKQKLSNGTRQKLKACLEREFKTSDLKNAFNENLMENNSTFTWMATDDSGSPLEINNTSSSDEGDFLAQLQSKRKKSLRIAKRKRELQKKWNQRKRRKDISKSIASSRDANDDSHPTGEALHTKSSRIPIKKKELLKQQEKVDKNVLEGTTPMKKAKIKLKQTKLNFQAIQNTNSDSVNGSTLFESKLRTKFDERKQKTKAKLFTSTPLHRNSRAINRSSSSSSLDIDNITGIEPLSKRITANKLNNSKNSSHSENKSIPDERTRGLLRSRSGTRSTRLSHMIALKEDQRRTRSMRRNWEIK